MTSADYQDSASGVDLAVGSRFGNYEIVRKLGEGGMGAVYEARRQGLNKRVALKVLTLGGNPAVVARFVQEARISASLEHPHVADCFDVGEVEGQPFLALEFLDGETLGARMERGPMGVSEIVDVALPVCSALWMAHRQDIVHRDLKPDNIFLARQLGVVVPKVLDFGIAKAQSGSEHQGLTRTASIMGTPGYMSPEQAKDSKNVTAATDQFALGVILWEAVAGRILFEGDAALDVLVRVVSEAAPSLRSLRPDVDATFDAIVAHLLEKEASRRFPSMRDVGAALLPYASPDLRARWTAEFCDGASPSLPPLFARPSAPPTAPTLRDAAPPAMASALTPAAASTVGSTAQARRWGVIAAAAALLVVVASFIGWRLTRADDSPTQPAQASTLLPASQPPVTDVAPPPPAPTVGPTRPAAQVERPPPSPVDEANAGRRGHRVRPARRAPGHGRRRRPID